MKKDLEDLLYQRYPALFADRTLPPEQTCMCRGMECGDGWFDLIDLLCSMIQFGIDQGDTPTVRIAQVKEKFGTLRFYIRGGNERVRGMIDMAVALSAVIPEQ